MERQRVAAIDLLRGLVMIIMALDHTRDYFSNYQYDPLDLGHADGPMFFTRWITHYCAPLFVFLSGTSAFLSLGRGRTRKQASLLLLTRGLWLIILELTIIRFGWMFNLDYSLVVVQVIWAIGWSMVFLSLLVFLNRMYIGAIAVLIISGHNLLDGIHAGDFGGVWWHIAHELGSVSYGENNTFVVLYPLVPWIGVMAAGYCFGSLLTVEEQKRNKLLYWTGGGAIVLFIVLRLSNIYGDPSPWVKGPGLVSFLSFLNTTKYPPSLLYLLMTLGPAIMLMPLLEGWKGRLSKITAVFGRVPLFYYILHIYLIHGLALAGGLLLGFPASQFTDNGFSFNSNGWGFDLPVVYGVWVLAVVLLYFPCSWFMGVKAARRKWWLSYL